MGYFERVIFLRSIPGLAEMPAEIPQLIAENCEECSYKEGDYVNRQGEPSLWVYYIVEGEVEIRRNGRRVRSLGPRMVVGGISAIAEGDEGYDTVALRDTVTLRLRADDGQEIFEDHFVFLRRVIRGTNSELLDLRKRIPVHAGFTHELTPDLGVPPRTLNLVERMALLRETFSFAEGNIDGISDLANDVREVRLSAGTKLWSIGDEADYFLMPLSGTVRGETATQRFMLGPTDSVGAVDALAEEGRWFDATVERDLVAFRVERDVLLDVLEDHFDMAWALMRAIAGGTLALYDQIATL